MIKLTIVVAQKYYGPELVDCGRRCRYESFPVSFKCSSKDLEHQRKIWILLHQAIHRSLHHEGRNLLGALLALTETCAQCSVACTAENRFENLVLRKSRASFVGIQRPTCGTAPFPCSWKGQLELFRQYASARCMPRLIARTSCFACMVRFCNINQPKPDLDLSD